MKRLLQMVKGLLWMLIALLLELPWSVQSADLFVDDHGDEVAEATLIAATGSNYAGRIEIDTDQDWFRFVALPDVVYRLEAQVATVWDLEMEFRGPHTTHLVRATSSALSAAPAKASLIWTNTGAAGPYYVGVHGYVSFTTGTYSFAVSPTNMTDVDKDGLPDAWEQSQFGNLAQTANGDYDGDGFSNLDEFYARTVANNASSSLSLRSRVSTPGVGTVTWPAVPESMYRIWRSTNLVTGSWMPLEPVYHPANSGLTMQWDSAIDSHQQFYQVELFLGL